MKNYIQFTFLLFMSMALHSLAQVPTLGLTAYWPFHANPNDLSGNNNNGIVYGATLTTDRFGNCNEAYRFDGIDDYILVHNAPDIDMYNTDFSIALWIKTANNDTTGFPYAKIHTAAGADTSLQPTAAIMAIAQPTSMHFFMLQRAHSRKLAV